MHPACCLLLPISISSNITHHRILKVQKLERFCFTAICISVLSCFAPLSTSGHLPGTRQDHEWSIYSNDLTKLFYCFQFDANIQNKSFFVPFSGKFFLAVVSIKNVQGDSRHRGVRTFLSPKFQAWKREEKFPRYLASLDDTARILAKRWAIFWTIN